MEPKMECLYKHRKKIISQFNQGLLEDKYERLVAGQPRQIQGKDSSGKGYQGTLCQKLMQMN